MVTRFRSSNCAEWSRGKCATLKCWHQVGSTRPAWPIEATRNSLSATKHKRDGQPASAKQPGRGRLQPVDRAPSAVERPDDIRAFMGRAARLRRSFDDAN